MDRKREPDSEGMSIAVVLVLLSAIALEEGLVTNYKWYYILWLTIPLLGLCLYTEQKKMS